MQNSLKKIRDELQKESPDLSYIRGILEVLIEEDNIKPVPGPSIVTNFEGLPPFNMDNIAPDSIRTE